MKRRKDSEELKSAAVSCTDRHKLARMARLQEQQMGFGTALPGSLPSLIVEILPLLGFQSTVECSQDKSEGSSPRPFVLCDIGAGCGNILSDVADSSVIATSFSDNVSSLPRLWGVEMNRAFTSQTPERWRDLIFWSKLEDLAEANSTSAASSALLRDTTVAYMYDLCLKRLTRKARKQGFVDLDPHLLIQRVLLNSKAMPALQLFISTYSPDEMECGSGNSKACSGCSCSCCGDCRSSRTVGVRETNSDEGGNSWRLVYQKKLPCSTDSYMFYVYQRVPAASAQDI